MANHTTHTWFRIFGNQTQLTVKKGGCKSVLRPTSWRFSPFLHPLYEPHTPSLGGAPPSLRTTVLESRRCPTFVQTTGSTDESKRSWRLSVTHQNFWLRSQDTCVFDASLVQYPTRLGSLDLKSGLRFRSLWLSQLYTLSQCVTPWTLCKNAISSAYSWDSNHSDTAQDSWTSHVRIKTKTIRKTDNFLAFESSHFVNTEW